MREMMKSKIHRATVTDANLNYEGSITVDSNLLDLADILPYEKVQVVNVNSGARFETYAIVGERGSGTICLNGAAARLVQPGDLVIIITYSTVDNVSARSLVPKVVHVDAKNQPLKGSPEKQ
ncbi:MAG: aspartate 1-decarboxylase [Firmicutes bacterium]|nr:aspartate 1-decarboxylase [Dethiobacter sp.]MBS3887995.1 aspartate 1-decarboxylase [Bacillota bacterium]MBS4055257.1 aspartate 1-decarboxylase [Thermaerobacter sp.]